MNSINKDLKNLNFQFLMVARECAKHHPMDAIWKFNLNALEIQKISRMTLDELKGLAECSRAVFTILPVNKHHQRLPSKYPCRFIAGNTNLKGTC